MATAGDWLIGAGFGTCTKGPCKLFVGGISSQTSTEALHQHFSGYGRLVDAVVMSKNGRSRGFGFVTFESAAQAMSALVEPHLLDGRLVDTKLAVPGEQTQERSSNKIFVGGLPQDITTDALKEYFGAYGSVADAVVMVDRRTNRSRGFGFVRFSNGAQGYAAAQAVLMNFPNHRLQGKWVEVKSATPAAMLNELSPCSSSGIGVESPMALMDLQHMNMFFMDNSTCEWDTACFGMTTATSPPTSITRQHTHTRGRRGRRRGKHSGVNQNSEEEMTPADDDGLSCFAGSSYSGSNEGSAPGLIVPPSLGSADTPPFVPSSFGYGCGLAAGVKPLSSNVDRSPSGLLPLRDPTKLGSAVLKPGSGPANSGKSVGNSFRGARSTSENDPSLANTSGTSLLSSPMKVSCRSFENVAKEDMFDGFTRDDFLALEIHRPSVGMAPAP